MPYSFGQTTPSSLKIRAVMKPLRPMIQTAPRQPLGRISGTVTAGGTPVTGATFVIDNVEMTVGAPAVPYATDATGSFLIGRAAGLHDVTITAPGYQPTILKGIEFVANTVVDLGPVEVGLGEKGVRPGGMSGWAIAALIGGGAAFVGVLGFVGWKLYKRRGGKSEAVAPETTLAPSPAVSGFAGWKPVKRVTGRRAQLERCGPQCFGNPDPKKPRYPYCPPNSCRPTCEGTLRARQRAITQRDYEQEQRAIRRGKLLKCSWAKDAIAKRGRGLTAAARQARTARAA